ncbi:MAG: bifunctional 4-hydroxy-2-oxoglutarate aldolase/2-dehydro-3-deoxy-phosphogluconate aldolase [Sphingobacteriales bacterium]|nr:bifunctional 4-hydroxy-2-oxoglutarate aldolase/2-dehydro-3-deoxy-phosphogluconate aldolase [Sphingobacteriales bacterium]MBI3720111.1 bifunctional 4-hydroxy-2-oxoglutarate aldolase/2-dehydro-3-deoxy-phosphogluconate aldolase [Sphingobacteriales bacterium]
MITEQTALQTVKQQGLLPLFYHDETEVCLTVSLALYKAGVRCIEFTNRGKNALANFKQLVAARDTQMQDLLLAAGTIKTGEEANKFIDAGADFLISPVFDKVVCDTVYLNKVFWIPGCMTPTEIHVAQQAGCKMVKLFPGNLLTPSFVEAIQPLFTGIDYAVTGGVDTTAENITAWFKAGVAAVGMGSKLISKKILETKTYDQLSNETAKVLQLIQSVK